MLWEQRKVLSEEEQKLIDEAVEKGKVRVIPVGKGGEMVSKWARRGVDVQKRG